MSKPLHGDFDWNETAEAYGIRICDELLAAAVAVAKAAHTIPPEILRPRVKRVINKLVAARVINKLVAAKRMKNERKAKQ